MEPPLELPPPPPSHAHRAFRSILIVDGSYANIGARDLPSGRINYVNLRSEIECRTGSALSECWYFDHEQKGRAYPDLRDLKRVSPHGPQFQVKTYQTKGYECRCPQCHRHFQQKVQKGVDNGIATKMLSLVYEDMADRVVLFAGDGDFYDTLDLIKNVKHKELWVIGYERSVSPDLQQLATKVLWIEDIFHGDDVAVVEGDESPPLSQLPTVPRALLVDSASDKAAAASVVTDQIPVKTPPAHPLSVFVNNLPFDTEKAEIESHFQPHGEVKSVRMPMDPQMGKCRGFAFVQFDSIEGVESALTSSGQDFRGRKLRVRRPFEHRGPPAADVPATTSTSKPTKTSKRKKNQDAADDGKPKRNKTDTTPRPDTEPVDLTADAVSTMWQLSLQPKHAKYVPTVIDLCDDEEGHKELNSDKSN
ncbi:hypothetical protein H257_10068 [Aphanomyces astaci]|uniref:Meiosis regulator and mRNA stability factor 1 n=1 Tax=Aphanomyces astaci TaxID=112090 RepID=W4G9Q6_APHAT|nr:hypothetical protein H257_10068 [Aphanomyces astaci]ETV75678.1 hypothetical protein H257_10068 [Aphanomyces astaci]|eukprot:XP_009834809.1 hypothetical protein H257_10068 [Aphanomyces astaci]